MKAQKKNEEDEAYKKKLEMDVSRLEEMVKRLQSDAESKKFEQECEVERHDKAGEMRLKSEKTERKRLEEELAEEKKHEEEIQRKLEEEEAVRRRAEEELVEQKMREDEAKKKI